MCLLVTCLPCMNRMLGPDSRVVCCTREAAGKLYKQKSEKTLDRKCSSACNAACVGFLLSQENSHAPSNMLEKIKSWSSDLSAVGVWSCSSVQMVRLLHYCRFIRQYTLLSLPLLYSIFICVSISALSQGLFNLNATCFVMSVHSWHSYLGLCNVIQASGWHYFISIHVLCYQCAAVLPPPFPPTSPPITSFVSELKCCDLFRSLSLPVCLFLWPFPFPIQFCFPAAGDFVTSSNEECQNLYFSLTGCSFPNTFFSQLIIGPCWWQKVWFHYPL